MYSRRKLLLHYPAALLAPAWAVAQTAQPPQPAATPKKPGPTFQTTANEVIVPVTVTDDKGRFINNLDLKDFTLLDEGRPQKIAYFTRERNQPVVMGFLVDLSNANRLHWDKFKEAVQDLVLATLEPDGKPDPRFAGYLVGYGSEAELMVNTTNDPEKILDRIRKIKPGGAAALFDAVHMACTSRALIKGEPIEPRRVIIIIGDGHDSASKHNLNEIVEIAQRNLVTIYGISTVAFGFRATGESNLARLTESTGGRIVYPLDNPYTDVSGYLSTPSDEGNFALKVGTGGYASAIMRGIVNAITATVGEITTQYILRYTPDESDTGRAFRRIQVQINLPNAKVRAREGYYPFAP